MGFTKFCAALLNHPDTELQAIPQTMLDQVLCLFFPVFPRPQGCVCVPAVPVSAAGPLRCGAAAGSSLQVSSGVWMGFVSQGLEALSGPRSSSITRRAAGFPMLFLCIVSGENPAQARPLLTRCIQTLLALASTALPQDWDQTLDLPQVSAAGTEPLAVTPGLGTG